MGTHINVRKPQRVKYSCHGIFKWNLNNIVFTILSVLLSSSWHPYLCVHLNGCAMFYCVWCSSIIFSMFVFFWLLLRDLLRSTCQGYTKAVMTQENTPVGSQIVYDGAKGNTSVTSDIFDTLAKVISLGICCLLILSLSTIPLMESTVLPIFIWTLKCALWNEKKEPFFILNILLKCALYNQSPPVWTEDLEIGRQMLWHGARPQS